MTIDRRGARTLAVLGVVWLSLAACGGDGEPDDAEAASGDGEFSRVINVEVRPVETTSFTEQIRLTGTVRANQDVEVAAEESGRIREIHAEEGSLVSEGQPLLKIDDTILRAEVEQARSRARLAEEMWERRRRLWEEDEIGTEQAYLEARANAEEGRATVEALEERLARTTIRAPFEGILEDRMVERGQTVSTGTPVARVVELDTVKVTAGVPERYSPDVEPGSPVAVSFDVLPDRRFEAEVSYVGSTVDPQNRTFRVEFVVENPERVIKPQMVANVILVRRVLDDAVVVPQEALVRIEDGFRAFVVEGEGEQSVVRARDVETGPSQRNRVVIEEGLRPGERLVVVGQQQVAQGDRVRIVRSAASPDPGDPGAGRGAADDTASATDADEEEDAGAASGSTGGDGR